MYIDRRGDELFCVRIGKDQQVFKFLSLCTRRMVACLSVFTVLDVVNAGILNKWYLLHVDSNLKKS